MATKNRSINPHLPPPSPPWLHFSPASPPASSSSLRSFFRSRAPPRGAGLRCSCVLPGLRAHTALPMPDNRERQAAIGFTPPGGESGLVLFPAARAVPTLTHGTLGRPKVKDCGDRRVRDGGPKGWTERGSGTSGRKRRDRERKGRVGGTRRTASPRRLPCARLRGRSQQLGRHRGYGTFTLYWFPPGPLSSEVRSGDWGLQKLPRGVLAAAPRACVASPPP